MRFLSALYVLSSPCREAVVEAAKIMHKVHEEETKPFEIEMTWLCEESGMEHQRVRSGGRRAGTRGSVH